MKRDLFGGPSFSLTDFQANIQLLELLRGRVAQKEDVAKVAMRNCEGDDFWIIAGAGKYVSIQFLLFLGGGKDKFIITPMMLEMVRIFFAPLRCEKGHGTIDFLRKNGSGAIVKIFFK